MVKLIADRAMSVAGSGLCGIGDVSVGHGFDAAAAPSSNERVRVAGVRLEREGEAARRGACGEVSS